MARMNTSTDEEREFQVNIIVSKDGPCRVICMERGDSGNRTNAETPLGDILGLRECLRMSGLMVRQFFAVKQRALDLRAKRDALLAKTRKQAATSPQPEPMVLGVVTGPLLLEVDEVTLEKPGPLEEGFSTHSYDGVATVAEDAQIEQWAEELTTEAEKYVGPLDKEQRETMRDIVAENADSIQEIVREMHADPKRDALIEAVVAAAHDSIEDRTQEHQEEIGEAIPGITTCLECEKPLAIVDDVATCINEACGYYDDAAALRVQRESRADKPKTRRAKKGATE